MFNPIAPRKVKIVHNFGLFECNRVKDISVSPDLTPSEKFGSVGRLFFFFCLVVNTNGYIHTVLRIDY